MNTWIFLRGLSRESGHWGAFIAQFQAAWPQANVIAVDLPGNGHLHLLRSPLQVPNMAAHCRAQLAQRGITTPYHLLTMSLGGMVGVSWAHTHPQEVASLVLINTSMRPFSPWQQRLRPANYGTLLKLIAGNTDADTWEREILRMTSNVRDASVLPHWLHLRAKHPVSRTNVLRQLVAAARFRAPLAAPAAPTLVLASERDQLVNVACSKALAARWRVPLQVHPTAGHDLTLDDGVWVAAQVRDWLKSI